jgi:hypothetical protein
MTKTSEISWQLDEVGSKLLQMLLLLNNLSEDQAQTAMDDLRQKLVHELKEHAFLLNYDLTNNLAHVYIKMSSH